MGLQRTFLTIQALVKQEFLLLFQSRHTGPSSSLIASRIRQQLCPGIRRLMLGCRLRNQLPTQQSFPELLHNLLETGGDTDSLHPRNPGIPGSGLRWMQRHGKS